MDKDVDNLECGEFWPSRWFSHLQGADVSNQQIQHPPGERFYLSFHALPRNPPFWFGRWNLAWGDIIVGYLWKEQTRTSWRSIRWSRCLSRQSAYQNDRDQALRFRSRGILLGNWYRWNEDSSGNGEGTVNVIRYADDEISCLQIWDV